MIDDRSRIHVDSDRDRQPAELLDTESTSSELTEQPETVRLPPQPNDSPLGSIASVPLVGQASNEFQRKPPVLAFTFAVVAVVILAGLVAVLASNLVGRANVSDDSATLIGMAVGVGCAVGAFLIIAQLTHMLGLRNPAPARDSRPVLRILETAQLDIANAEALGKSLGITSGNAPPAMLDLIATEQNKSVVVLRVLDERRSVTDEMPFPDVQHARAYARKTYGVREDDWIELS